MKKVIQTIFAVLIIMFTISASAQSDTTIKIIRTQYGYSAEGALEAGTQSTFRMVLALYESGMLKGVCISPLKSGNDGSVQMNIPVLTDGQHLTAFMWDENGNSSFAEPVKLYPSSLLPENRTLHLVGDSIVANYPDSSLKKGWGMYIGEHFNEHIKINNTAVSGYSTKTYIDGYWDKVRVTVNEGDYVMISLGINDTSSDTAKRTDNTVYKANLQKFVDDCNSMKATVIFITPTITISSDPIKNGFLGRANVMKEVAESNNVPCLDLNTMMFDEFSQMNYDEVNSKYFTPGDTTHQSEAGSKRLAEMITELLKSSDSSLKKFLK